MYKLIKHILLFNLFLCSSLEAGQICKPDNIQASTPTNQFIDHANGTVTDKKTGLMWKKCSEGQSSNNCQDGQLELFNFGKSLLHTLALNTNGGFAGFTDWRVPNIKELASLKETQCLYPAINLQIFPNTYGYGRGYLSSTPYMRNEYYSNLTVWTVVPESFSTIDQGKDADDYYLRLVRTAE